MNRLHAGKSILSKSHSAHRHDTWEIVSNIKGTGTLIFDSDTFPFDDRTIVCIPPGVAHAKESTDGYLDIWAWFSNFSGLDSTKPTFLTDDSDRTITQLMRILYSVQYGKTPNREPVSDALLDALKQLILSRLEKKSVDPRVEEIVNEIVQHFQDPTFSPGEVLSQKGYCSDHMRRLFREQTGCTPHEYLTHLRIKTAKKLLASRPISNYSVTEISMMVGFTDSGYFSRLFKKTTGISPNDYRGE